MTSKLRRNEKEFDLSFTIRRKEDEVEAEAEEEEEKGQNSILADVYGTPADTTTSSYSSPVSSAVASHVASSLAKSWSALEHPTSSSKRTWQDANTSKTYSNKRYKETFTELHDSSLPTELLSQFQPLFCKLCMFQLSGNSMAKLHYKSKNHDKKIRAWLIEYSAKTKEPLHPRATIPRLKNSEQYDPKHYYCSICDLPLTGKMHAESHYMGKNHLKVAFGKKNPTGPGYYNEQGQWVRITKKDAADYDGIGHDFARKDGKAHSNEWRCELCQVAVTSAGQLEIHEKGLKHKKKLRTVQEGTSFQVPANDLYDPEEAANETEDKDVCAPEDPERDSLSTYRTPSGQFYCENCNMSMNSELQFTQHLLSKKHTKKLTTFTAIPTKVFEPDPVGSSDDIFDHL